MKSGIARCLLAGTVLLTLGGTPALFADDLHRDYRHLERENAEIRSDRYRLHEDAEHGRYWRAARDRAELRHDYVERGQERRDLRRDERWR